MIWALLQAEVAVYIIAQVIPLLRVMVLGEGSKAGSKRAAAVSPIRELDQRKSPATAQVGSMNEAAIELIQLSSGRIVPVDSQEARAEAAERETSGAPRTGTSISGDVASVPPPQEGYGGPEIDDAVHKKWSDMGLSRRAWSKSPSPQTEPATL